MNKAVGAAIAGILLIVGIVVASMFIVKVPEGQVAVVYKPNGGVTKTLDAGWKFVAPLDSTTLYQKLI